MTTSAQFDLIVEFTSYWLSSTGGSGGGAADAPAYKDRDGCPAMPMTTIKGALRETASRILPKSDVDNLFGSPDTPARLYFIGDAVMEDEDQKWFAARPRERAQLFRQLHSTRINERGVAADKSLRTVEACVPMTLRGTIIDHDVAEDTSLEGLKKICALTVSLGKHKTNGFGRALIRCQGPDDG